MTVQEQMAAKIAELHFDLVEVGGSIESIERLAIAIANENLKIDFKLKIRSTEEGDTNNDPLSTIRDSIAKAFFPIQDISIYSSHTPRNVKVNSPQITEELTDTEALEMLGLLLSFKERRRSVLLLNIDQALKGEVKL